MADYEIKTHGGFPSVDKAHAFALKMWGGDWNLTYDEPSLKRYEPK